MRQTFATKLVAPKTYSPRQSLSPVKLIQNVEVKPRALA